MRARITKRAVDAARPGKRDTFYWDDSTTGLGLKVTPAGKKTYVLQYRIHGRVRRYTIGKHGSPWTPEQARDEAVRLLGQVAAGIDPAALKAALRREGKAAKTVAQLCDLYVAEDCATKKPSTLAADKGRIERHIKPLLGRLRVKNVTDADVARFLGAIAVGHTAADIKTGPHGRAIVKGGKGAATRATGLLGAIFSYAVRQKMRPDNPVHGVKRFKGHSSQRFLSDAELARLGEAMAEAEREGVNPVAIAALRLLCLSGMRKTEVLSLEWQHVDFDHGCLRLADSKTGEKVVPVGAAVLALLTDLPRVERNPYVFPGEKMDSHFVGLPKIWLRIRKDAGLSNFRLHDLRHSFASVGASGGHSLLVLGELLGHRTPRTTARYAHLSDSPVRAAADRIAGEIASAMNGKPEGGAEVHEIKRKA